MPKLPAQALPPDKRPKEPPPPFESMLPSGLMVKWRLPRLIDLVSFDGMIPDPYTASCIDLLEQEKSYTSETDPLRHKTRATGIRGMLHLTAAMWESPRFDPSIDYGSDGVLGQREVGYQDHIATFQLFRFSSRQSTSTPAKTDESERIENAPQDRGDVPPDASTTTGDN